MPLSSSFNGSDEINNGYKYDKMRLLTLELNSSDTRVYDIIQLAQNWSIPSRESLMAGDDCYDDFSANGPRCKSYFSATCWHFGKRLNENLKVPIGLQLRTVGWAQI
jgi:sialate O-acetylesterase